MWELTTNIKGPPGAGGTTVLVSDTPPDTGTTPVNTLWWESDTGLMYVLYDDGSSVQWVAVGSSVGGDVIGPPSVAATDRIAVFDGTTGKLIKDGGVTIADLPSGGPTGVVTPQTRLTFDAAITGQPRFDSAIISSEFDNHYTYTGPAPSDHHAIGSAFYTIADPSTNVDNHYASYNGVSGTVYSTSTTVTCNLVGGNFTAYRSGGSTNPIIGVSGAAVFGAPAIGNFTGDGGAGGYFNAWVNAGGMPGANGTDSFSMNAEVIAGKSIGVYARSYVTTTAALNTTLSIGVLGLSQVESNAANSIGGWFGAKSYDAVGDVGNKFGVIIDDISGALNLNMALRTGLGAVQFGGKVAAPSGFVGDVTVAQIGTTVISSVHTGCFGKYSFTDNGTKTYTYKVVPVFASGVTGPASAAVTTALGFDNLATSEQNNLITFAPVEGAVGGYDIYRTVAGGTTTNTTGKIGNCPQNITREVNGNSIEPTTPSFVDVGQVGDGSTPPAVDTTGTVTATKFVGANFTNSAQGLTPASGGGTTNFLRADGTWSAAGGGTPAGSGTEIQYRNGSSFGAMAGTTWDNTNRSLMMAGAAVTTNNPVLNLSQEWNAGAVAFSGITFNATNTASANGSKLLDLQVGGVTKLAYGIVQSGSQYILSLTGGFTGSDIGLRSMSGLLEVMQGNAAAYAGLQALDVWTSRDLFMNSNSARLIFGLGYDVILTRPAAAVLSITGSAAGSAGYVRLNGIAAASLPTPSATYLGCRGTVTDSTVTLTAGIGAVVAGGGSLGATGIVPVFCDGTNWRIG